MERRSEKTDTGGGGSLVRRFIVEEDGIGVVEVILIMVVLIAAVALFKTQIISLVTGLLEKIATQSNKI